VTDQVTDIAPILVWSTLRVLECRGAWTGKPNGLLADLTPLEGMNLAGLKPYGQNTRRGACCPRAWISESCGRFVTLPLSWPRAARLNQALQQTSRANNGFARFGGPCHMGQLLIFARSAAEPPR